MLNEVDVENLIQPFADRQKAIENYIVNLIARRVREIGTMKPSDIYSLERLLKTGSDVRDINKKLAQLTGLQESEIKKLIKVVAADSYADAKPFYDYRSKPYIPLMENTPLSMTIEAVGLQTMGEYKNLANTQMTGFVIRDLKKPNKLRFYNVQQTYKTVLDEAIQAAQSGVIDYNSAMRRTLKQLNNSGMQRVYWEDSGYKQRMDTAVKRTILDGIRNINLKIHEILGKQFGANGVELTAHHMPAEDHAPFQGHIFTNHQYKRLQNNKDFKDINGKKFAGVRRVIGQWNCKHFAYPIIIGVSKPKYSEEQLQDILDENEAGAVIDGKHYTLYELLQKQNQLALKVRQMKDGQIMAVNAGDLVLAREYQAKVSEWTKRYKSFNAAVKAQVPTWSDNMDKLTVSGYKRIPAA